MGFVEFEGGMTTLRGWNDYPAWMEFVDDIYSEKDWS